MTQRKLLSLVGHWQDFLGLAHWTVGVDFEEPAHEGARATIFRFNTYDNATLFLARDWLTWDTEEANEIIVHELLHLHARDLEQALNSVEEHVDEGAWKALHSRLEHELEGVIDRLAIKFVELANS